jgi:uncharacterized protein YaiI (UPF0178 family)
MLDLFVDIDACPVSTYPSLLRVARRHSLDLYVVTKDYLDVDLNVHLILTDDDHEGGSQWIAANIRRGDICVTGQIDLAANCTLRDALALAPTGRMWTSEIITAVIAGRAASAPRLAGGARAGSRAADIAVFAQRLDAAIATMRTANPRSYSSVRPFTQVQRPSVFRPLYPSRVATG